MGVRSNQSAQSFVNVIKELFFEVNTVDGEKRLRLVLQRENSKYPDWYSCGSGDDIKLSKDGRTWKPADFSFPGRSMAIWFLNGLMDACEKAGVAFDEDNLASFEGMKVRVEDRTYSYKIKGKAQGREKPFVIGLVTDEDEAPAKAKGAKGPDVSALADTLTKLLEANDGEMETEGITAKALKDVVEGDYSTRKAVAAQLADVDFLGVQEVATLNDGVLTLN